MIRLPKQQVEAIDIIFLYFKDLLLVFVFVSIFVHAAFFANERFRKITARNLYLFYVRKNTSPFALHSSFRSNLYSKKSLVRSFAPFN